MQGTGAKRAVIGLSGGVDSSVAAYLLKERGYDVIGVTLRMWQPEGVSPDVCDAREVAGSLGIPFYEIDCRPEFEKLVIRPFSDAYMSGTTPNPCVKCNREVKWHKLLEFADEAGAEYVATGHYARIEKLSNGRYTLSMASMSAKDQTYMLYRLSQEDLKRTLMPLGEYTKEEVRAIAADAGIKVAAKKDSQEICFIPDGDHAAYIEAAADAEVPPEGDFVDASGNVLGKHKGIIHYTVGQRKGLGIALGHPVFVNRIDPVTNNIELTEESTLFRSEILCRDLNFMSVEGINTGEHVRAAVKIRYQHRAAPAMLESAGTGRVRVVFDEAVRAPAPGQSAVFYDDSMRIIGGGIITE